MGKRKRGPGQEAKAIVPGSRFSEERQTGRAALVMVGRFARKLGLEGDCPSGFSLLQC